VSILAYNKKRLNRQWSRLSQIGHTYQKRPNLAYLFITHLFNGLFQFLKIIAFLNFNE
jgi:hypothetical protein